MEKRLRQAINDDELQVYYQAQLEIASGRVVGADALVRWLAPAEGLIMPDRFIGLSEQTRLIVPIGDWVLQTACRQVESWIQAGLPPIRLAVNLSAFQASRPDAASRILAILTETGFVPQALELELTENSLGEDRLPAVDLFVQLQNLGVTLALDDFGAGSSSLTNLERYPVSALKIDRRFIAALPQDKAAAKITMAIIALAHTLGFRTVAEGVETEEQLKFLAKEGCDACQGFLFSPPLPAEEFAQRHLRAV
jgi:EAL domain-containing protein (putative c-di-GMP-specific phosphodiesterase class I)